MTADGAVRSPWLRRFGPPTRPGLRLVCLPHAGGSAGFYHSWSGALGAGVEVLSVCYPGREERFGEPGIERMDPLADELTAALLPLLDTPLALFGHSMGASVAYEVALRLERLHGFRLSGLFVSCRKAPHRVTPSALRPDGDDALLADLRRRGGTPPEVLADPELRSLILPAIRSDFRLVGEYRARPAIRLDCPVTGFLGDRDPDVSAADMREWETVAGRGFDLEVLPGDHFYLAGQRDALLRSLAVRLPQTL